MTKKLTWIRKKKVDKRKTLGPKKCNDFKTPVFNWTFKKLGEVSKKNVQINLLWSKTNDYFYVKTSDCNLADFVKQAILDWQQVNWN